LPPRDLSRRSRPHAWQPLDIHSPSIASVFAVTSHHSVACEGRCNRIGAAGPCCSPGRRGLANASRHRGVACCWTRAQFSAKPAKTAVQIWSRLRILEHCGCSQDNQDLRILTIHRIRMTSLARTKLGRPGFLRSHEKECGAPDPPLNWQTHRRLATARSRH
jgi:hypothetical protein